jgi:CheY-like chemotaxis protein
MLAAGEKANILLVDDMPARLLTYEAILGSLDQNLVRAQSGEEALAKLLEMEVATILLDVSMPGMDGFETAAMIRGHPRSAQTPIIFVTGVPSITFRCR